MIDQAAPRLEARESEWAPFGAWLASQPIDPQAAIPIETMRLPPALFEVAVELDPASSSMLGPRVSFEPILPQ